MSQVTLKIGDRSYAVNCADGEEDHIAKLGAMIDEKYSQLGGAKAPQETQNMLFAALFLADELAEARKKADKATKEAEKLREKASGKKTDLKATIETLTTAEARAREEVDSLKEQLAEMREAARQQHDLFGAEGGISDELVETLEKLAEKAETTAEQFEGSA